ncbi:UDP-galactose-lipid carrier transferase [Minicystis rosea]|nr:UDP-galactose-lipid carrier transferase [Minicystis rosea]
MFESAELGHAVDKETYESELPALREALLDAQYDLLQSKKFPVVILISGVDGAGKGETVNLLHEWMDPRLIQTHAFGEPTEEERERPSIWRFWRALPPKGKTGIFFTSWYTDPILQRVHKQSSDAELDRTLDDIRHFERMLTAEGALILKFWFHLSKDRQHTRLKRLENKPKTRWRVTKQDWRNFDLYDRFRRISERSLRETSTAEAPWLVVEGTDERYRSLTVGKALLAALRRRLDEPAPKPPETHAAPFVAPVDDVDIIKRLDLAQRLDKEAYEDALDKYQRKLALLTRTPGYEKHSVIAVFEGADAAGKGGAIRRVTGALDARHYRIVPIAAPTEEERAQPYLWRFWRHVPRRGVLTIFDRSWYGRVLVERVERFAAEPDWMRAYSEINDFEEQLVKNRTILVKFWLQISQEEQLRRFESRETIAFKRFKITEEDWRNRDKWGAYQRAVCDMIDRTSTEIAPWTLVEAEDKYFARAKILRALCDAIEEKIG